MKKIDIGKDFTDTPLGRYASDGSFSGERFRDEYLLPALKGDEQVSVIIDDVEGYGSSFLEEAFGGLVRKHGFTAKELHSKLIVVCESVAYQLYKILIWKYIDEARPETK